VNFASALFAAVAVSLMALAVFEALSCGPLRGIPSRKARGRTNRAYAALSPLDSPSPWPSLTSSIIAALLLACSRTLWAYATIAEVYTLNAMLILICFVLMLRWRRSKLSQREGQRSHASRSTRPVE